MFKIISGIPGLIYAEPYKITHYKRQISSMHTNNTVYLISVNYVGGTIDRVGGPGHWLR